MKISKKYKPLFETIQGKHPEVDTVIITGGRDSAKSFTSSLALCDAAANYNHRILYTRYTLTSAKDSIIPDFNEKIALLNYEDYFHVTNDRILGKHNQSKIVFKGVKTSAGNQTATLKSLKDFSIFVSEEAEEYPSFDEWDKIQLSIRATDVQSLSILILNPATRKHWIYKNFFSNKGVKDGFNGIKGNVLYIHTTYEDVDEQFIAPKNLRKYKSAKEAYNRLEALTKEDRDKQSKEDIKKWKYYKFVVLGGWKATEEGLIIDDWTTFDEFPPDEELKIFGLDFGYSGDPSAFVEERIYPNDIYIKQHIYKTGILNHELADMIHAVIGEEEAYVVADHARGDLIDDLNRIVAEKGYNYVVIRCKKGRGSVKDGLDKMKTKNIHIHKDSKDIQDEADHYHVIEIINSKGETVYHVVDKDNHAFDAARYAYNLYY